MARKRSIFFHAIQSILKNEAVRKKGEGRRNSRWGKKHFPLLKPEYLHQYRQKFIALLLALLTFLSCLFLPIILVDKVVGVEINLKPNIVSSQISNALELEQKGNEYYNTGRFAEAAEIWQLAADSYGKDDDGKNKNIINKAKALQSLGLYPEACSTVIRVFFSDNLTCEQLVNNHQNIQDKFIKNIDNIIDKKTTTLKNEPIGLRFLGEIIQRFGELNLAKKIISISLKLAENFPDEKGAVLIAYGNIERAIGNRERDSLEYNTIVINIVNKNETKVFEPYKNALKYYHEAATQGIINTEILAKLNHVSLLLDIKEWWVEQIEKIKDKEDKWDDLPKTMNSKANELLSDIKYNLDKLPQNREAVYAKINFSNNLIRLNDRHNKNFSSHEIDEILSQAIQQARDLKDKQALGTALSSRARVYELFYEIQVSNIEKPTKEEQEQNIKFLTEAKILTQEAIKLYSDINIDNRQILYRQRRQLGRILKAQGKIKEALISYAEAWNILQSLRGDLVTNIDNQFAFRQNVEPVYREFIDLLLSPQVSEKDVKQLVLLNNIAEGDNFAEAKVVKNPSYIARIVMESLQLAELDNFFQEPCSQPVAKSVQIEDIAPDTGVIYPIILENRLEVIFSLDSQTHYHHYFSVSQKEVRETLENLANIIYSNAPGQNSAAYIHESQGSTIKEDFEINKKEILKISQKIYKWLIEPLESSKELIPEQIKNLVFVLDRPFQKIPIAALYDCNSGKFLIEKYNVVLNVGQKLIEPKPLKPENIKILAAGVSEKAVVPKRTPFPALKGVEEELNFIRDKSKNLGLIYRELLRDPKFTKDNFQKEIKSSPNLVLVATHGVFSSNREQTFIVSGEKQADGTNRVIDIDDFRSLFNPNNNRNKNVELLILSACQTASGDEKAALGIAGVVLRSGASSTVASLWSVSDAATAELMKKFFENLTDRNKKMTRAEALRNAQVSLLQSDNFNHPFYWAPFTLIGNWL